MAGEEYLGWPRQYIADFLNNEGVKKVVFVPYAGVNLSDESLEKSYDVYSEKVSSVFSRLGFEIVPVHKSGNPVEEIENAEAIAVGGGNTFHLVAKCTIRELWRLYAKRLWTALPIWAGVQVQTLLVPH